ncbi:MAG: von Willebrand factor type A domain-containing protein, partial [Verrucomicrobiota bacterium]|nr:von Willebrand factor type A domain-containing protein [Verrucomicrobiota bacterium]
KKEFDNLPKEELSDEQKESLLSRNKIINTSPTTFSKISRWTGISAAAACFIGMGIIGFDSLKNNTKQESLTDSADERSFEMPPQSLSKVDEQKTALKDTNIQGLSLEPEAILENDSEAKENKNRRFNRSLAKKQSIAVPQPAASIAANSINIDNGGLGAVEAKQKVESGLRYSSNASSAKRLGRSARQEKLNFEYSEQIQLGADDFSEIELSKQAETNNEQYGAYYDTPFVSPLQAPLSTFAIDVDTASYSNVRRYLGRRNQLPPQDAVRVEEMINYFDYDYRFTGDKHPFSVHLETASSPWKAGNRIVRIGLKAKELSANKRPPSNLIFLIDCSGSMGNKDKLPLLKESCIALVENLTEDDRIGIVTYAGGAGIELDPVHGDQKEEIIKVINGLRSGGSTNGEGGIRIAYDLAKKNFIKDGTNRIIIATDGDFNVGISDRSQLIKLVKDRADKDNIYLTALGFGEGNIKDHNLEQIANNGNGEYYYIDSFKEGKRVLVDKMNSTLVTIAKDVKIQVDFNPRKVGSYRLIGYANRKMKAEDFRNDEKDAGEIGAGHTITALYEITPPGSGNQNDVKSKYRKPDNEKIENKYSNLIDSDELLTVFLRYKNPEDKIEDSANEFVVPLTDSGKGWEESSDDFRFASSVAGFGMLLRNSKYAGDINCELILELASEGIGKDKNGLRKEFIELVNKAKAIKDSRR